MTLSQCALSNCFTRNPVPDILVLVVVHSSTLCTLSPLPSPTHMLCKVCASGIFWANIFAISQRVHTALFLRRNRKEDIFLRQKVFPLCAFEKHLDTRKKGCIWVCDKLNIKQLLIELRVYMQNLQCRYTCADCQCLLRPLCVCVEIRTFVFLAYMPNGVRLNRHNICHDFIDTTRTHFQSGPKINFHCVHCSMCTHVNTTGTA